MKAVRVHEHGGPEVLRYEEVPDPRPAAGTAVVEVKASGVNFIDIYHRTGQYPAASLPYVVGTEAAGIVREVGEGVSAVRPGDRVACFAPVGTYAEAIAVPADRLVPVPPQLDLRVAAALLLQGMTAHYLALSTYPLRAGVRCVVHAAAGGVGLLLCQIARRQGAEVIAITSTPEKAELARAAGANQVIGYDGFDLQVRALTAGRGVEVVYDSVGKTTFEASLRCLAPRGMLALYGQASGAVPPLDPQVLARGGSLYLTRPVLGHYVLDRAELLARADDLFRWILEGSLSVRIGLELPLAEAREAHRRLGGRDTTGKVLLIP
ncbi:MAG: quinone oxidoreductase [Candidatus Eisenbacteria bacterium]|nr:quinone oxidoreductase [Candidatus Eisenbacteria bacterium]